MSNFSNTVSKLSQRLKDIQHINSESVLKRYRNERLRYLIVTFAKKIKLIPEDYTDPEFERAFKIVGGLPKLRNSFVFSEEDRKIRIERLTKWYLSKGIFMKYIRNFDDIKLKFTEGGQNGK